MYMDKGPVESSESSIQAIQGHALPRAPVCTNQLIHVHAARLVRRCGTTTGAVWWLTLAGRRGTRTAMPASTRVVGWWWLSRYPPTALYLASFRFGPRIESCRPPIHPAGDALITSGSAMPRSGRRLMLRSSTVAMMGSDRGGPVPAARGGWRHRSRCWRCS